MVMPPAEFVNDHKLYIQTMGGGEAIGRPDTSMALYFDDKGVVRFFEYAHAKGMSHAPIWSTSQFSPASFQRNNVSMGDGVVTYEAKNGGTDTLVLKAKGVLESTELAGMAVANSHLGLDTSFYATNRMGEPGRTTTPFATHMAGVSSAVDHGALLVPSGGKPSSGKPSSKGTTTTDTSQSTMYVLGGGALIGLLFLFTQK